MIRQFIIQHAKLLLLSCIIIFILTSCFFNMRFVYRPHTAIPMHFVIGIYSQNKPLCFKAENNTFAGFEIDFINEIMKRTGRTCELKDLSCEEIMPNLQSGAIHMAIAGITPTCEQKKLAFFTLRYLENGISIAISKYYLEIADFIDNVLQGMQEHGYIEVLKTKWDL